MFDKTQVTYLALREIVSEKTRPIIAWIGAGASAPAGLPSWKHLKEQMCEALDAKGIAKIGEDKVRNDAQAALVRTEKDYWASFQMLKEFLGKTTYRETIRHALKKAESATIPVIYDYLWKLGVNGILNLNIDPLAKRSYSSARPGKTLHDFAGKYAASHMHVLRSSHPFIAYLHGLLDDESSWVFTASELNQLFATSGYKELITSLASTATLIFIGISADDTAAGGHLTRLRDQNIDFGTHFWITDRNDSSADKWAEESGVRVIRFANADRSFAELNQLIRDLVTHIPPEQTADPVAPSVRSTHERLELPLPDELEKRHPEEIRELLNDAASAILAKTDEAKYLEYEKLCSTYDSSVYKAWYIRSTPPGNVFAGYTIIEEVAEGGFGTVYRGEDINKRQVAVKILHEKVRRKLDMLQSFRRGVAAMNILSGAEVAGIVPYIRASEVPASVVMDFVEGPSLAEAVEKRLVIEWAQILRIAIDLAYILKTSHGLPQRVLHRDVRPSNIMIRNGYVPDPSEWEVVVLDFDLSWHKDALELSVGPGKFSSGYLSPEQLVGDTKTSTRNALVDSYGLGMTLLFLRTAKAPIPFQHRHGEWNHLLGKYANESPCRSWLSLPNRFFRLIEQATLETQLKRWGMTQIHGELLSLQQAILRPAELRSADLLAEEIAYRSFGLGYKWDVDKSVAIMSSPTGLTARCVAHERDRSIAIEASWKKTGKEQHARIKQWIFNAADNARSQLQKSSWSKVTSDRNQSEVTVRAIVSTETAAQHMNTITSGFIKCLDALNPD
ncbi:protein kinase domain-containing protein [Limnoglobus roseus]|uniref:HD domain-containing protein n=1 Tax=Limnoglobus roseus TaxID=2598579 RepID=A0A5C1AQZ9_9BACT|nr:SIR2 family protein [Limnoglobus roseus]QEL19308.1 HD domain-containing protein [Limnoglobus roseus]